RVVVKNGFTQDLADFLIDDLTRAVAYLDRLEAPLPPVEGEPFHHGPERGAEAVTRRAWARSSSPRAATRYR
ncbi:MAG: hypothetical protein ABWY62_06145, partial [Acidimicrobiia bacterium]